MPFALPHGAMALSPRKNSTASGNVWIGKTSVPSTSAASSAFSAEISTR